MADKKEEIPKPKVGDIVPVYETQGYQIIAEVNEEGEPLVLTVSDETMAWIIKTLAEIKEMLSKKS